MLKKSQKAGKKPTVALVASILIGLIGVLAIIGWATDNALLKAFLPDQRPINPMAAAGLINLSLVFFAYYCGQLWLHRLFGFFSIVLGAAALTTLPVDTLLFSTKVLQNGAHTSIADTAAVCFILTGPGSVFVIDVAYRAPVRRQYRGRRDTRYFTWQYLRADLRT